MRRSESDGDSIRSRIVGDSKPAHPLDSDVLIDFASRLTAQTGFCRSHFRRRTTLVHNGAMKAAIKTVRRSVSLPAGVATEVRSLAKARKLSANRLMVELIEYGVAAEKRKQQEFFDLAERFRNATDPEEVKRLGDRMGRMVFGA